MDELIKTLEFEVWQSKERLKSNELNRCFDGVDVHNVDTANELFKSHIRFCNYLLEIAKGEKK